jgi:chromosome segregation ATPase
MRSYESWIRVAVIAALAACSAPDDSDYRSTDERATRPAVSPSSAARIEANDGSLAALTAEVRQLRVAVEQLARTQTEAQALGVALSAQQGRVLQVTQQLDAVRKDIDFAATNSRSFEEQIPNLSNEMSRSTDAARRDELESMLRAIQAEHNRAELELQQIRARESNLSRSLALEEKRWNDLLARMERLTR